MSAAREIANLRSIPTNGNILLDYTAGDALDGTGTCNIAAGLNALGAATSGDDNVAIGRLALGAGTLTGASNIAIGATADFMFALISTEELEKHNQIKVKQLKNRYNDPVKNRNFVVGIDRAKMKLYDVEEDAQKELNTDPQEKPVSKSSGAMSWDKFQKEKNKKTGLEGIKVT